MAIRVRNPYIHAAARARYGAIPFDELHAQIEAAATTETIQALINRFLLARDRLIARYAWAIPNVAALRALAAEAPLVEIGAGTGYWASLLRQMGVDILAFDANPPLDEGHTNRHCRNALAVGTIWTKVRPGGPEQAGLHADRTLFLCWPPSDEPMAAAALAAYHRAGGRRLAFVGELGPTCGDEAFREALHADWRPIKGVGIPRWRDLSDALTLWEPRETGVG